MSSNMMEELEFGFSQLLTQSYLSSSQRADLLDYLHQLQQHYTQWARQWMLQLAAN